MVDDMVKGAATDGITTFLWVFSCSALGVVPSLVSSSLLAGISLNSLFVTLLTSAFDLLLSSGSYNPSSAAAFYYAGLARHHNPLSLALRLPAQAAASAAALFALLSLAPPRYRHLFAGGPTLNVSTPAGATAEGILTFLMTFALLYAVTRWPKSVLFRNSILAVLNALLILPGAPLTGPSMNPVTAFGRAYVAKQHASWEHFYVYWAGPFVGAVTAGLLYYRFFASSSVAKDSRRWRSRPYHPPRGVVPLRRGCSYVSAKFRVVQSRAVDLRRRATALSAEVFRVSLLPRSVTLRRDPLCAAASFRDPLLLSEEIYLLGSPGGGLLAKVPSLYLKSSLAGMGTR